MKLVGACLYTPETRKTDLKSKSEDNPMESPEKESKEEVVDAEHEALEHAAKSDSEHHSKSDSEHHSKSDNYFSRKFGSLLNRSKRKYKKQESQDTASQNGEGSDRSPTSPKKHGKGFFRRTKSLKSHESSEHNEKRCSVATEQPVDNGDLESLQNLEDRSKRRMTHTKYGEQRQVVVQGKALREVEVTGEKPQEGSNRKHRRLSKKKTIDVDDLSVSCRQLGVADFEGWMFKKSGGTGFTPVSWKKWWCVLKDEKLYLYKTSFDQGAHHVYHLKNYTLIQVPEEKRKCSFKIQPKNVAKEALADAKAIVFATEAESEVDRWSDVLQKASQGLAIQAVPQNEEALTNDRRRCYTTGTKQMKAKGKQNGSPQPKSWRPRSSSLTGDETTGLPTHSGSVSGRTRKISNSGTSGASVLAVGSMFRPIDNPDDRSRVPMTLLPDEEADPELEEKAVTPRAENGGTATSPTDEKLPDVVESTLETKDQGETDNVGRTPTAEELQRTLDVRKEIERLENQARVPEGSRPKSDVEHGDNHVIIDSADAGDHHVNGEGTVAALVVVEKQEEEKETAALQGDSMAVEIESNEAQSSKEAGEEVGRTGDVAKGEEEPDRSEDTAKVEKEEKEEKEESGNDDAEPIPISVSDASTGEGLAEAEDVKEVHEELGRPTSSSGEEVEKSDDACSEADSKAEVVSSGSVVEEAKASEDHEESEKTQVEVVFPEVLSPIQEVDPALEKDKKENVTVELDKSSGELNVQEAEPCSEPEVSLAEVKEDVTEVGRDSAESEEKIEELGKKSDKLKEEMEGEEKSLPQPSEGVEQLAERTVDVTDSHGKEKEDITTTMTEDAKTKSVKEERDNEIPLEEVEGGRQEVQIPAEEGETSPKDDKGSSQECQTSPEKGQKSPEGDSSSPEGGQEPPKGAHGSHEDVHDLPEDKQGSVENEQGSLENEQGSPSDILGSAKDVQGSSENVHGTQDDVQASPDEVQSLPDDMQNSSDDVQSPPKDAVSPVDDAQGTFVCDEPQNDSKGVKVISESDNTVQKEESDEVIKRDLNVESVSLSVGLGNSTSTVENMSQKSVESDIDKGVAVQVKEEVDAGHEVQSSSPVCDEQIVDKKGDQCDTKLEGKEVEDSSTSNSSREENNNSLSGNFSQVEQKSDVTTPGDGVLVSNASPNEGGEAKLEENSGSVVDDVP